MSLVQVKVLGEDTQIQLDAEDDRTYRLTRADGEFTVDMLRVGDKITITLLRPAPPLDTTEIHRHVAQSLDEFDAKVRARRR